MTPLRLALVAASPVYYQAPLYRRLAGDPRLRFKAFFASSAGVRPHDPGFGLPTVVWDVDSLSGYDHEFLTGAPDNEIDGRFFGMLDLDVLTRLRAFRPDVLWVHGYSYATIWLAIVAAKTMGIPLLVREEQTLLHGRPWPRRWAREAVLRSLFARAYGLYISSNNYRFFRRYGLAPERLFFTPYAVDNELLRRRAADLAPARDRLRERFGIAPAGGPVVLFVGKLISKKNPQVLLGAFERVRASRACTLLFVGEGDMRPHLESTVRRHGTPDVHFAGFVNQSRVPEAYACADVFVLPSRLHETFGVVVAEAMNFGLPVVASDKVGSAPDLVRDGVNGYVFARHDVATLARRLEGLVGDEALRRRLGERSRRIVGRWHAGVAADGVAAASTAATGR